MSANERVPETLGRRVGRLRVERELTRVELGHPEFTACYVAAVERDCLQPCAEALELLARRLEVPPTLLRAAAQPPIAHPEQAAVDEDIGYQLAHARLQLNTDPRHVLWRIRAIEQQYPTCCPQIRDQTRFWLHGLRGMAYLRTYDPLLARPDLDIALQLAPSMTNAAQEVVRMRNALGATYYMLDQPDYALHEHAACLRALRLDDIKDPNLRVIIYSNLANDYWALNDIGQAIGMYQETLGLLDDIDHGERRGGVLWGLCLTHAARKDLTRAKLYASEALALYTKKGDALGIAHISNSLAEIEIERQEYDEATTHLARAETLFRQLGEDLYVSQALQNHATLELMRDRVEQAAGYAEQALQLCEQVIHAQASETNAQTKANRMRTYARVLGTVGCIAEKQGLPSIVDARFQQAIAILGQATYHETAFAIESAYADLLVARGAHARANAHYHAAARRWPQRWRN